MKDGRLLLILGAVIVATVAVAGWAVMFKLSQKAETTPPEVPPAAAPTATEAAPQTNKVVLEEAETPSGETLKAVSGKLVSIEGQVLVLEVAGDRLKILVSPEAKITRTSLPAAAVDSPTVTEITLADLEIGQRVDALVRINVEGTAITTNINMIR